MGKPAFGYERCPMPRRRGTLIACPAVWAAAVVFAGSSGSATSV